MSHRVGAGQQPEGTATPLVSHLASAALGISLPLLLDLRSSLDFPQTPRIARSHSSAPDFQQAEGLLVQHLPSVTQGLAPGCSGWPSGTAQGHTDLGDLKAPCLGTAVSVK